MSLRSARVAQITLHHTFRDLPELEFCSVKASLPHFTPFVAKLSIVFED
jgi:hypothetical protein